jgi:hypothetical protein
LRIPMLPVDRFSCPEFGQNLTFAFVRSKSQRNGRLFKSSTSLPTRTTLIAGKPALRAQKCGARRGVLPW